MKKIFLPLVLGLALVSCSRDNDDFTGLVNNEVVPMEEKVFLTKIKKDGEAYEWHFTYDESQNRITSVSYIDDEGEFATRTFTYNTNDQIVSSLYEDSLYGDKIENTYSYDAEGRLVASVSVSVNEYGTETTTRNYNYNTEGKVIVSNSVEDEYGDVSEQTYTYTLNGKGQVIERLNETGSTIFKETYVYDDVNKTPFANVRGLSALMLVEGMEGHYSQDEGFGVISNVLTIKEEIIEKYGTIETNVSNQWSYNEKGYPIQRIENRVRVGSNINIPAKTYTYEYNK